MMIYSSLQGVCGLSPAVEVHGVHVAGQHPGGPRELSGPSHTDLPIYRGGGGGERLLEMNFHFFFFF